MATQATARIRGKRYHIKFNKHSININGILYLDNNPHERRETLRKSGLLYTQKYRIDHNKVITVEVAGWYISRILLNKTEIEKDINIETKKIKAFLGINEEDFIIGFVLDEDFYPYMNIIGITLGKQPIYGAISCKIRIYPSDIQRLHKIIKEIKEQKFFEYEYYPYSKLRKEATA